MELTKLKVMLLGDSNVGKTSAIKLFCDGYFNPHSIINVGCDIKVKKMDLDGDKVQLELWDTVGLEQHNAISTLNYRNIKGVLLMYDVTSISSFKALNKWIDTLKMEVPYDVNMILIGNKCDVSDEEREVDFDIGLKFANKLGIPFFEVSCKNSINISEPFFILARSIKEKVKVEEYENIIKDLRDEVQKLQKLQEEKKKCCVIL